MEALDLSAGLHTSVWACKKMHGSQALAEKQHSPQTPHCTQYGTGACVCATRVSPVDQAACTTCGPRTSMPCRDSSTWMYTLLAVSPDQRLRMVAAGRYRNCGSTDHGFKNMFSPLCVPICWNDQAMDIKTCSCDCLRLFAEWIKPWMWTQVPSSVCACMVSASGHGCEHRFPPLCAPRSSSA